MNLSMSINLLVPRMEAVYIILFKNHLIIIMTMIMI
jgi:hypothetical protein